MQIKKDDIRQVILEVAKKSFLKNGFRKTSMRDIAKKAEVTLSNIYNYFKNKDEILEVILTPMFAELNKMFTRHNEPAHVNLDWFYTEELFDLEEVEEHINLIVNYREELDLYLHKCSGSKYENAKDELTDRYTISSREYLQLMKDKYPQVNKDISDFFIHISAAWWMKLFQK